MKFDAGRVTGMIEELDGPQYKGQDGEANTADFLARQFTELGMTVERRDVIGSRFPQRVAPWAGWLVYGALITSSYVMLRWIHPLFIGLPILLLLVGLAWLHAVVTNGIRLGRRMPPLETAPLVIASFPIASAPPVRVVFHAVLGGFKADFFQSFHLNRLRIAMSLHCLFLMDAAARSGRQPGGTQIVPIDSILLAMIWIEIACVLSWEYRCSRSTNGSRRVDRRGLAVLSELARNWPRTRSNQIEAVFVAAGGQRLDHAGAREVVRLLRSEWSSKPTFLVLFLAPGAGDEVLVVGDDRYHPGLKKLIDAAAKSLWIPIRRAHSSAIAPFWPIASAWPGGSISIIGSDLNTLTNTPVDPLVLHRAIQLSTEIALRWAKEHQQPAEF